MFDYVATERAHMAEKKREYNEFLEKVACVRYTCQSARLYTLYFIYFHIDLFLAYLSAKCSG